MKRCYFGIGLLAVLLLLSLGASWVTDRCHSPVSRQMREAAEYAMAEDWDQVLRCTQQARSRWVRYRKLTASLADHEPMEEIEGLFGELEIWLQARDAQHCATVCARISGAADAMADAHALTWWNVL